MNGKLLPGAEKPLYVSPGMKKAERLKAIQHEANKFKTSKKRCNLFVKNFPDNTTEDDLRALFRNFGEIESLKVFYPTLSAEEQKEGMPLRTHGNAFVCFTTPDSASLAKAANLSLHGRPLYVNYYEIKQQRVIKTE
jgi:polyadenylate-binding protein